MLGVPEKEAFSSFETFWKLPFLFPRDIGVHSYQDNKCCHHLVSCLRKCQPREGQRRADSVAGPPGPHPPSGLAVL